MPAISQLLGLAYGPSGWRLIVVSNALIASSSRLFALRAEPLAHQASASKFVSSETDTAGTANCV